jgi:uncharacterized membrane protein YkvA (DUF1232 family)
VPCAELYRHLPELFLYLAHVALDERVPERERLAILSSLKYVVAPFDLIPEGLVGTSGFRDDLVLAAFVVERLEGRVDPLVLREHWEGPGTGADVARAILDAATPLVGTDICDRLRRWLP